MRILLAAYGSFGDLHPMIALAVALQARGVDVTLASHPDYQAKVEASGLRFLGYGPSRDSFVERLNMPMSDIVRRTARDVGFMFTHLVAPEIEPALADLLPAAVTADLVIGTSLAYAAHMAATLNAKPFITAALMPTVLMSAYDPPKVQEAPFVYAPKTAIGRSFNRLIMGLGKIRLAAGLGAIAAIYRKHGLPPQGAITGLVSARMTLALFSPLLATIQPDYPFNTQITGTPFYDSEDGHAPVLSPALTNFLGAGPPPLVFSLGSAAVYDGDAFYRQAREAAARLQMRCVILCGAGSPLLSESFGEDMLVIPYAPHSLLFPRALAVIHHGGVGSTAQALRSGRPILTTPVFADQFDNASRIEKLGAGLTLNFRAFTADRAAAALKHLLDDKAIARTCISLSQTIAAEEGAGNAADIVLATFK